jgi:anti-sigma factor RsiW
MKCRECRDLLIYLAYGDLPPEHQRRMDDHLRQCIPCAAGWRDYQEVKRLAQQLPAPPLPPDVEKRLQKLLH